MQSKQYYAVKKGRRIGLYETWAECEVQVKGYQGAIYKKFKTKKEAYAFIDSKELNNIKKQPVKIKEIVNVDNLNREIDIKISKLKANEAVAFVDGSYRSETIDLNDNIIEAAIGYGAVILTKDNKHTLSKASYDEELLPLRNVSAEILATKAVIAWSLNNEIKCLDIYYDYAGIEMWALKKWRANNDITKAYATYFDSIKDMITIRFYKVESHTGVTYNEEADILAASKINI